VFPDLRDFSLPHIHQKPVPVAGAEILEDVYQALEPFRGSRYKLGIVRKKMCRYCAISY